MSENKDAKAEDKPAEKKEEGKEGEANKGSAGGNSSGAQVAGAKFKSIIDTTNKSEKIVLNSEEEKFELERVRRWKVHIDEIYITSSEMFDCFVRFTIGGDLKMESYNIPEKNKKGKIIHGARGFSDYTEVMEILNVDTRKKFNKEFNIEIRDSITNLKKQNLVVECWDYNFLKLNNYQGFQMIDLMKIIRGNIYQSVMINKKIPGEGNLTKPICKIEFKIVFQEIWDFVMTFEDWSATNVNTLFGRPNSIGMYPGINFTMKSTKQEVRNKLGQKDCANPEWGAFNRGMPFRGTLNDLQNQLLVITISADSNSLINRDKVDNTVDLKGITVNGLIKKYVPPVIKDKSRINLDEVPESLIAGKININAMPRFKQIGFESVINVEEIYICIFLQNLTFNQPPPFCKLPINVFLTVDYNGKTTETYRIPIQTNIKKFDQYIYFLFGEESKLIHANKELRLNSIIKNLKLVNEVAVNLWIEDTYKCLDFIGKFNILLTDIFDKGKLMEKKYKKDDNTEISYLPKVFQGEDPFESAYLKQEIRLKYDVWFYPDEYTKNIDWPKEGIKRKIKENPIIEEVGGLLEKVKDNYEELKSKLQNQFADFKKRFFDFIDEEKEGVKIDKNIFYVKDQNGIYRIFNSYLSKLTIQEVKLDEVFFCFDIDKILKERAKMEKMILPIKNRKGLIHYMKCIRYIHSQYEHIILSPDYFMQTRKGTKFEHTIFLACLMMNIYSNKYPIRENDEFHDEVEKELELELQKNNNFPIPKNLNNEKNAQKGINNEVTKFDKNEKHVTTKGKEFELVGINTEHRQGENDKVKEDKKQNETHNNMNVSEITIQNVDKSDLSKIDKTKNLTDRSVDQLIKKDNISKINEPGIIDTHVENKNKGKEKISIIDQLRLKIEENVKKRPEFRKKNKTTKFDTSDLVFVCWGTLKGENQMSNTNLHMWVMSFERNFKDIYFWEPLSNKKYVLKNRVMYNDILKKYFKGAYEKEEQIQVELKKKKKKNAAFVEDDKKDNNKKRKHRMDRMLNGEEDINTNLISQVPTDIIMEMEFMDVHVDMKKGLKYSVVKNNQNLAEEEYIRTHNLIKKSRINEEEQIKGNQLGTLQTFKWDDEYCLDDEEVRNDVLPYRSIDVIFNKKNIFVNKQNPNPIGIYFDLYDRDKWYSVLKIQEPGVTDINAIKIWKQDIPAFYSFKSFLPYYTEEEIDQMKKNILNSVSTTIKVIRNQKNLNSFFKANRQVRELLDLYIIFIEMKDLGLTKKAEHKRRMELWREYMKQKMTNKITIAIVPIYFNYSNETLISSYIEENCIDFVQKSKKDSYFILTCKIFQYPNRVISVRLLIAICYKVPEHERDDEIDPDLYQTEVEQNGHDEEEDKLINNKENNNQNNKRNILLEEK